MGYIIGAIILLILMGIAVVCWLIGKADVRAARQRQEEPDRSDVAFKRGSAITFWALFAILVIVSLGCSFVQVSTRSVGIVRTFGAVSGKLDNGPNLTWPWQDVDEMTAAVQTDTYVAPGQDAPTGAFIAGKCFAVRIANQQTACVPVSIRWRVKPVAAPELFKDFRSFEHVRDSLVTRDLGQALNTVFKDYNPLAYVAGGVAPAPGVVQKKLPSLTELGQRVTDLLDGEIGNQIEVKNQPAKDGQPVVTGAPLGVIIPIVTYDDQTQARINQLQQQVALTRIAQQAEQTATYQAKANKALAASVSHDPNVLVARCLDTVEEYVKKGGVVPPAWSCWPGAGAATAVVPVGGK